MVVPPEVIAEFEEELDAYIAGWSREVQAHLEKMAANYDPNQPRDENGMWTDGVSSSVTESAQALTREFGGTSISLVDGHKPTEGYMVAKPPSYSKVVDETDFFDPITGRKILSSYMKEHKSDLAGTAYMGTWVHEGKVYLDVSENILDRAEAIRLGVERNQKAIWDVVNETEIDTGGTGE